MKRILQMFKSDTDFYKSISELPMDNWWNVQKTNDLTWLLKYRHEVDQDQYNELETQWKLIYAEYVDTFGISSKMNEVLELKRDIAILTAEMYLNKDRSRQTFIDIKERELKMLLEVQSEKFDTSRGFIEKYMGFSIDTSKTSVLKYYGYTKFIEEDIHSKNVPHNGE